MAQLDTIVYVAFWGLLMCLVQPHLGYTLKTVDTPGICNETIILEGGTKSSAILRLTGNEFYDFTTPRNCVITFRAPRHTWSGLTGVLEEMDMRRYEDSSGHHLAKDKCIDYIVIRADNSQPDEKQCGSWSVSGKDRLSDLGSRRELVGSCPGAPTNKCVVTELRVEVTIGRDNYLTKLTRWRRHKGFTFVVTAYRYPFGEGECSEGLRSCGKTNSYKELCVHQSLWCDRHINCGQREPLDELSCIGDEMLGGLVTVMVGPWVGAALLLLLVFGGVFYWRRARLPVPRNPPPQPELNSYAESYEVSSTLSSAHHMAIQVRVVCNPSHGPHGQRSSPWVAADLPPSYDSLFPQGPPPPKSPSSSSTARVNNLSSNGAPSFDITTTSLVSASVGSNRGAPSASSNIITSTTQTSSIVIPLSAICSNLGTYASSVAAPRTTFTTANSIPAITNTTTATASISLMSPSSADPPAYDSPYTIARDVRKIHASLPPSHNTDSSRSSRVPTPTISTDERIASAQTSAVLVESSPVAYETPPIVEPEDTEILACSSSADTEDDSVQELLCTVPTYTENNALDSSTKTLGLEETIPNIGAARCNAAFAGSGTLTDTDSTPLVQAEDGGSLDRSLRHSPSTPDFSEGSVITASTCDDRSAAEHVGEPDTQETLMARAEESSSEETASITSPEDATDRSALT